MTEVARKTHFKLKLNGEDREIKMTFGLVNEICRLAGDIDAVPEIAYNPDLREAVLISLLSERNERGEIVGEISVFNMDADPEDVVNLLDWASEHAVDFFLKALQRAKKLVEDRKETFQALMPSSTGSPA